MSSATDVFWDWRRRIDFSKFRGNNRTVCLTGTSGTKKTSMLLRTGKLVHKTRGDLVDTYAPAAAGAVCSGMEALLKGGAHFEDRTPYNCYYWHVLWLIMNHFFQKYGNVPFDLDNPNMYADYLWYCDRFVELRECDLFTHFDQDCNTITIIDTNIARCDSTRAARGQGSDVERSNMKYYTFLQNLMFVKIRDDGVNVFDLAEFDDGRTTVDAVIGGAARLLEFALNYLNITNTIPATIPIDDDYDIPSTIQPQQTLLNMYAVHGKREWARWICRTILTGEKEVLESRLPTAAVCFNFLY